MEDLPLALFAQYGALSFGWLLAGYLLHRQSKNEAALRDIINKNTAAFIKLETIITERISRKGD